MPACKEWGSTLDKSFLCVFYVSLFMCNLPNTVTLSLIQKMGAQV